MGTLIPHGTQGEQSRIDVGGRADRQRQGHHRGHQEGRHGRTRRRGGDRYQSAGVEAGEPGSPGCANDHDSQGLFQQRPSSGWGTVEQITDPEYSTTAFLNGLKQVEGWQDMPLTEAAQTVQVSAFPFHYAQWETQAAELVAEHWTS